MTGDEIVRRTRMALAEAGYPTEGVLLDRKGHPRFRPALVPPAVIYKARQVVGVQPMLCFSCWAHWSEVSKITGEAVADIATCVDPMADNCGSES